MIETGRALYMNEAKIAAIILAGGTSTRMGQVKQLLPLGKTTVLAQTLNNVRAARVDEIIIVLGASAQAICEQVPLAGLKVVVNQAYAEGMASSLRAGVSAVYQDTQAALIVLADQPFIQPETLDHIVAQYRRSHAQIVIPAYRGKRGNPVLLDRAIFAEVQTLRGDVGCRALFGNHLEAILQVETEDPAILLDIDNRNDYDRLIKTFPGHLA